MSTKRLPPEYPESLPPVEMRERMLERLDPKEGLESALAAVHAKLVQAALRMEQVGDGGRFGVALGMNALLEYFSNVGVPYAALSPIYEVQAAIVDARRGVESPIFRPDRVGGGAPPTPARHLEFEGYLAVITDCCVSHCRKQGTRAYMVEGCKLAAKLIRESSWDIKPDDKELREIRERVRALREERPDNQLYRLMLDSPVARDRPLDWAKLLLKHDWINRPPANFLAKPPF
ncbi:hypothetical protein [Sphingopyxis macrogoltabida]|uniref:Asparagine synthase n=1 Tax=Sphingopyxis macrogoltabida TaxID=33050 RepID=A0AAC9FFI6_SPHMC|nr:hypothetical protein [Sphingopyxis macrogoltabida]ALJ13023.1 asparagine synthase (glutamine-hydrolysing) [Sphingopyxis macrogoltabida]AMU89510.1 asparagine synthase [Sphingopyxis macrogoltabida]